MPRIAPLSPPHRPDVAAQLAKLMPAGEPPIALFRMLAKNLPMTTAMGEWGRYELGRHLTLTLRDREIVIDRTCARTGCEYEWSVHVARFAERAGLGPQQVTSLTHGDDQDHCWKTPRDRLLIRTVDALHDADDISDPHWSALTACFSEAQVLDLLMLCGWYQAISLLARVTRLGLEPGAPTFESVRPERLIDAS